MIGKNIHSLSVYLYQILSLSTGEREGVRGGESERERDDDDDDAYSLRRMDLVIGKATTNIPSTQFYLTSVTTGI